MIASFYKRQEYLKENALMSLIRIPRTRTSKKYSTAKLSYLTSQLSTLKTLMRNSPVIQRYPQRNWEESSTKILIPVALKLRNLGLSSLRCQISTHKSPWTRPQKKNQRSLQRELDLTYIINQTQNRTLGRSTLIFSRGIGSLSHLHFILQKTKK